MPLSTNRTTFTFNHADQVDEYGASVGNFDTVQTNFDSRAEQNLTDINNIKTTLASETVDDSGAHNVKSAGIAGILSGAAASIHAMLSALKSYVDTAQMGQIPDGSLTDAKLSDTAGQIKNTVSVHKADTTAHVPLNAGLLSATDLNTITSVGLRGITNNNCPNSPTGSTGYWYIFNMSYGVATIKQIAYGYLDNKMYIRYLYNAVWSTWEQVITSSGGTMSGELNMADNLLTRPYIKDYAEAVGTTPTTTGAVTFDLTTGNTFNLSPTGACTLAITNPPVTGRVGSFTLMINMPATLYAMTYPASFKWDKGTIPTLVISKMAVITGFTIDAGTTWHCGAFGTEF
jgi:hypothetical protein